MVLGSAPEAAWVVQELLDPRLGYRVHWLAPGAVDGAPQDERLSLTLYEGAALTGLQGHVGGFEATLRQGERTLSARIAALVVATGNERYFPAERYPVPLSPRVWTLAQAQKQLAAPCDHRTIQQRRHERFLVLLDAGDETAKEISTEALQLARGLRRQWCAEVYVFYRELKVDRYGLEQLTRQMRDEGVVFCRYSELSVAADEEGVTLTSEEGTVRGERLVLPEAVRPAAGTRELAALLQVRMGEDGYFQDVNIHQFRPGLSNRRGIFFAGRCHLDGDEPELRLDAAQAVANVDALLRAGALEPDPVRAQVDPEKCIRCLTCIRTCPHIAVELSDYGTVTAARVVDLACQGCGACVCNCPVQAIEMLGLALPAWAQGSR